MDEECSAALVVRVWVEGSQLRARLTSANTYVGHEAGESLNVAVASSPVDVIEAVRVWLEEFLQRSDTLR